MWRIILGKLSWHHCLLPKIRTPRSSAHKICSLKFKAVFFIKYVWITFRDYTSNPKQSSNFWSEFVACNLHFKYTEQVIDGMLNTLCDCDWLSSRTAQKILPCVQGFLTFFRLQRCGSICCAFQSRIATLFVSNWHRPHDPMNWCERHVIYSCFCFSSLPEVFL